VDRGPRTKDKEGLRLRRTRSPSPRGLRLGPRLFLLVVLSSLLPAALILLAGWLQLRQQMRLWTIPSVETALESSLTTNRRAFDRLQRQLEMEGRVLAESRLFPAVWGDTAGLADVLDAGCREYGLDVAQVYLYGGSGFHLLLSRTPTGPGGPDGADLLVLPAETAVGPQRASPLRLGEAESDFLAIPTLLWHAPAGGQAPPELRGALVLGVSLGPRYYARLGEVSNGLFFYRRLEEVGMVLRAGYGLLAALILLVSMGFSLWIARKVAGSVSRPVEELVRGMEAVGRELPSEAIAASGAPSESPPVRGPQIPEIARLSEAFALMRSALTTYEERLRETERVKGAQETARFVAHEIRNTLTPVRAAMGVLERQVEALQGEPRERAERALGLIRREADRMASLAGAFSEYAHFPERKPSSNDLGRMLEELARDEVPAGIDLELRLPDEPFRITADRDELERLFRNLIKNAVESMGEKGSLRVIFTRIDRRDAMEILIEDTGAGMDPQTLRKVFHPGFTTKETGTGLGLALVRSSLSHYGGTIRLESEVGRGTRCRITLPLRQAETGNGTKEPMTWHRPDDRRGAVGAAPGRE